MHSSLQVKSSNTTGYTDHTPLHYLTCTRGRSCRFVGLLNVVPAYVRVVLGTRRVPYPLTDHGRSD